jgi:asparagine synthase (glutamine-hydrolysing)
MCGIAGLFYRDGAKPVDTALLGRMNDVMHHRGPDDAGLFVGPGVGLAHRRLSIIDIAGGHQPMHDDSRRRTIVYNGEIYNFREVRQTLEARGVPFTTSSDTEVLLKAAEFQSVDWVEQLNGMFAFALWDASARALLLGRDRMGVKPLYYALADGELIFASEIKPILLHPKMRRRVAVERIPEYIAFRTLGGTDTLFEGIQQVPAGHVLTISQADFSPKLIPYWREGQGKTIGDYVDPTLSSIDQLDALLKRAVNYRLISDVPVGSFNSGGVDSSLNSSIMRSLTDGEMHTFSVGFKEPDYDESRYARMVATRLGTSHHTLVIDEREYLDHLEETLWHLEEPVNHAHSVQLLLLSRLAKQHVTVALTGEGADEVFGGYPRLQIPLMVSAMQRVPRFVSSGVLELARAARARKAVKLLENAGDVKRSIIEGARYVPRHELTQLFSKTVTYPRREAAYERALSRQQDLVGRVLYFDQRTYLPGLLTRLDKTSMASGLECRVPFLDVNVVEWSRHLSPRQKIRLGATTKYVVKKVAERWLPAEIVHRRKVGFGTPIGRWFRNRQGLGSLLDVLTDQTFRQRGYMQPGVVERMVREHVNGTDDHHEALWGLVNLELWCRKFIDSDPNVSVDGIARTGRREHEGRASADVLPTAQGSAIAGM